ncbi:MAG: hypothetical protein HAW63_01675 [Bdellovibrionaceae bacterium]|nr:hypothetical protein [Pseudobdellovibrionaceae bacterium]
MRQSFKKILYCTGLIGYLCSISAHAMPYGQNNLSIFSTTSELSCAKVASGYKALLNSSLYIAPSLSPSNFFDPSKIEPFIADNIFKHIDPNQLFFTEEEKLQLKNTNKTGIFRQILSGNCKWYSNVFKKYKSNQLKLKAWYEKNILSTQFNHFIYQFVSFFNPKVVLKLEALLKKPWAKISLKDINNLSNFSSLKGIGKYIQTDKQFSIMQVVRFEYNSLLKQSSALGSKSLVLNQAIKRIYNVAINGGAVHSSQYKNHVLMAALVNSMDAHSFYKRSKSVFTSIENKVSATQKAKRFQSKLLKKKVAYIQFSHFYTPSIVDNSVSEDFIQALKTLDSKSSALIIDVRNNLGGSFSEAIRILGSLVYTSKLARSKSCGPSLSAKKEEQPYDNSGVGKFKEAKEKPVWYAPMLGFSKSEKALEALLFFCNRQPYFANKPIVILINQASASSAEILALGLQEAGIAIVLGTARSFGKGTAQANYEHLQLTDVFWASVLGKSIQQTGVSADMVFNFPLALQFYPKNLIVESDLPRTISNPGKLASAWANSANEKNILNYYATKKAKQKKLINLLNKKRKLSQSRASFVTLKTSKKKQEELMFKDIFQVLKDWKNLKEQL